MNTLMNSVDDSIDMQRIPDELADFKQSEYFIL